MATATLDDLSTQMQAEPFSQKHSSITVNRRTDRGFYMRLVQFFTARLRNRLVHPKEEAPRGCPRLTPHKIIRRTCHVSERVVDDIYLYDVRPKRDKKRLTNKRIYYFCGGGWQSPPSSQHWQLAAKLARDVNTASTTIVSYPLAPNNPAPHSFPALLKLYRTLMRMAEENGDDVILAGDSSGGNIVLCLVLEALREDVARTDLSEVDIKRIPHPKAIMAICPSTDLTRSNPGIEKLKQFDPLLTPDFVKATAKAWKGDWDATDSRISPIFADISLLAKADIRVHGVTGGYDILSPDGITLREKLADTGVTGEWLHWEKQMHCFVLAWPYGMREGREGVGWIISVLKKE
ncbi:alpha/beta-hydrolase [Polyplosphaeria fusca]|uniref:Alpha/beta-hydrolase n=1 Tax=Polyplosphaeria fusca TaxID=682080 RepID=A0A9P4QMS1_9PLEO|nr:alpha/beta-hydrolase [Polyplosphaeria fusca]